MNFIFIINDLVIGFNLINAEEISEKLLDRNIWLISLSTPHFTKFSPEDKVLIYLAGKGRRYFAANFTIKSDVYKHDLIPTTDDEKILFKTFDYAVNIDNIRRFEQPVPILDIKEDLAFIKDKKNYGLFFRQATKLINDEDYSKILNFQKVFG